MAARLRKNGSDAGTTIGVSLRIRGLAVQFWPIEKLIPYVRNARTHSEEQVAQVAASIVEFGWTNPVLVGADGVIIAGHARLAAARKLGITEGAGHRAGPPDGDAAARTNFGRQPPGDERRVG
jgi:ParB/Sulfiredoxin domain